MMMRRSSIFFTLIFFLTALTSVHALIISEIMYDPEGSDTDREWIEVLNDTGDSVDVIGWKFFEGNTNHGLTVSQGSPVISSGGYAVIVDSPVKFLQDYPSFSGTLLDSSFSLSNSGEALAIKDASLSVRDSITYTPSLGGNDDGTTLSFISGAWVRGDSTPGSLNILSNKPLDDGNKTATTVPTIASIPTSETPLAIVLPSEKIAVAGADSDFVARAVSGGKNIPENAVFTWSFGDGGTRTGRSVMYHYQYPGVYIAVVEVAADGMAGIGRMKVRVIDSDLSIARIGADLRGMYVDLANKSPYEVDVSGWKLGVNGLNYILPKNTYLSAKQTVRMAGEALGIASTSVTATSAVRLLYPNQEEAVRYIASTTEALVNKALSSISTSSPVGVYTREFQTNFKKPSQIKVATATATTTLQAVKSDSSLKDWFRKFLSRI